jgi:plastocyanin
MKRATRTIFGVLLGLTISLSTVATIVPFLFGQTFAQENETANATTKMMNTTTQSGTLPSLSTPGEKTFYVFTSEVENVDETKLKVAGDSFSVHTLVVNKGDKVTVHFYNVDDVKTERHSFTIGDPYKVDIDLGFAQNGEATFKADHEGVFTYYCKYHLPAMVGQLVVLP